MSSKKFKKRNKPAREHGASFEMVRKANLLNLSINIIIMKTMYGFGKKRLSDYVEAYMALMTEVSDQRASVEELIKSCREITGFDAEELMDDVFAERWRKQG